MTSFERDVVLKKWLKRGCLFKVQNRALTFDVMAAGKMGETDA